MRRTNCTLRVIVAIVAIACVITIAGCKKKTDQANPSTDQTSQVEQTTTDPGLNVEPTYVIETPFGELAYPETWKDQLETEIVETEQGCNVDFYTTVAEQRFWIFSVIIGGEDDSAGTLTAADGTVRNVSLDVPDLGDISYLSQTDQDQLYAMQEGLNVVVENLG